MNGFAKAPKGKLPYIEDAGAIIADSSFIRFHIEDKYGFDFDAGLDAAQKGIAWSIEKMLEDHLYWLVVHDRWMDDDNFNKGPAMFFKRAPALIRPVIVRMVRRKVRQNLLGQGAGRHTDAERARLARRAVDAIASVLGEKPFLTGEKPCGADATIMAFLSSALCPLFASETTTAVRDHANLVAYCDRALAHYFPKAA